MCFKECDLETLPAVGAIFTWVTKESIWFDLTNLLVCISQHMFGKYAYHSVEYLMLSIYWGLTFRKYNFQIFEV